MRVLKSLLWSTPVVLALGLTVTTGQADAVEPDARSIMEKVEARDDGDNQTARMEMTLIDRHGSRRVRNLRTYGKDKGEDSLRLMFFLEPADVKNTAFLTYDYDDPERDDDQWLFLPALRKTKRIASSDKSGSFMGSDFSYADMTKRGLDNYTYKLLKSVKVNGIDTWLIETLPVSKHIVDLYGYTKSVVFVRKDNYMVIRAVSWVKEGKRLKYMDVKKLEQKDGIWVATEIHMTTKKGKQTLHKTTLKLYDVKFNQDLDEQFFSIRQMEKGL